MLHRLPLVVLWLLATGAASLLTIVVAAKDMAVAILFMTCGLGMPVLLAPTLAAYLACLGPSVVTAGGPSWAAGASVSAVLVLALALAPPAWSKVEAAAEVARVTAADTLRRPAALPRSLEIVRPAAENPNWDVPALGREPCGPACRALLLGGEVDWVRVVTHAWAPGDRLGKEEGRMRLARAGGADCTAPDAPPDPTAECVIFVPDVDEPAALVLRFEDGDRGADAPYPGAGWAKPSLWRRVTGSVAESVVLRRTEARLRVVHVPTLFVPEMRGMSSGGIEISRVVRRFGEVSLASALHELGYALTGLDAELARDATRTDALVGPPDEEATRRVVSILDLPSDAPFPPDQQQAIEIWLASARAWSRGGFSEARIQLVRRIVADPRVTRAIWIDQIVERTPDVAAAVLPDVIARTEALGLPRDAPWTKAWYGLMRVSPSVLHPHAARIATLVDAHPQPLVRLAGRLGVDPTRWLLPLARGDVGRDEGVADRLRGACMAEATWSGALIPPLRAYLEGLDLGTPGPAGALADAAARALARHGDADGARARLLARGEDGARAWRRLEADLKRGGATDTLCL